MECRVVRALGAPCYRRRRRTSFRRFRRSRPATKVVAKCSHRPSSRRPALLPETPAFGRSLGDCFRGKALSDANYTELHVNATANQASVLTVPLANVAALQDGRLRHRANSAPPSSTAINSRTVFSTTRRGQQRSFFIQRHHGSGGDVLQNIYAQFAQTNFAIFRQ